MTHASLLDLFAGELRRLRTKAGLTQEGLATRINYSASLVGLVEQCRRMPRLEFTEQCDAVLEAEGLLLRIRDVISHAALLPWFREWVAIEQEALSLRSYESLVVPGLLQTEDYVRALHEGASPLVGEAMEQQVLARMNRQAVLNRADPPDMLVVLDHGILLRPVGGPKVMREQLLHLVAMGRRPGVHIHVVPETVGAYRGLNGPFVIATPNEGRDIAYIDNQLFGTVVERPVDVRSLQQTWDAVRAEALSHQQSLNLITEAAERWN